MNGCCSSRFYRQARDLADKTTRRRIRRWRLNPESAAERPHLSGALNQYGGPSFFPKETVLRHCRDKVYSELAGLEADQLDPEQQIKSMKNMGESLAIN